MPATIEKEPSIKETPTAMSARLKAETDAAAKAVSGGGFDDPEFSASLQAAIDKDSGKIPEKPAADDGKEKADADIAAKAAAEKKPAITIPGDIPPELLGEKPAEIKADKPAADEATKAEAERQKFLEEQTKGMTPKAAERFKKIELRAYEAEQKAKQIAAEKDAEKAALQKQIQDFALKASKTDQPSEVEAMKKQVEEWQAIVEKSAIQEDPRFKARYDGQISSEIEETKKMVAADNSGELAELMAIPVSKKRNERIKEIIDGLDDLDRIKVLNAVAKVDRISSEKASELSRWKENKIHVEARLVQEREVEMAKQKEIQQVAWDRGMTAVASPQTGLEVFRKAIGNDEWNAKVDGRVAAVQKMLANPNIPPEHLVEIVARSVASEDYRQMFLAQRILVQKMAAELAELKKAEPDAAEAGGGEGAAEDKDDFVTAAVKGSLKAGGLVR